MKFDDALKLFDEAIASSEASPEIKVINLLNRRATLIELERFDEALKSREDILEAIKKIPDSNKANHYKEIVYAGSLRAVNRAIALSDDQNEVDRFKQMGEVILKQVQEIKFLESKLFNEFISQKEWFQDILLLHDLQSESKVIRDHAMSLPIATLEVEDKCFHILHFLLHSLQGNTEKATKSLIKMLDTSDISPVIWIRKNFFKVVMKINFLEKKPELNKEGLNKLKDCIIQILPSLASSLRIQVMMHALCKETFLGHLFHSATGARAPSLARKGRLKKWSTNSTEWRTCSQSSWTI